MTNETKREIGFCILTAVLSFFVGVSVNAVTQKIIVDPEIVKELSEHFKSVDKEMAFDEALTAIYNENKDKDKEIKKLKEELAEKGSNSGGSTAPPIPTPTPTSTPGNYIFITDIEPMSRVEYSAFSGNREANTHAVFSHYIQGYGDDDSEAVYLLNGKYTKLTGTLACEQTNQKIDDNGLGDIRFINYDTDETLQTVKCIGSEKEPQPIEVDLTGCNKLKIKFEGITRNNFIGDVKLYMYK